MYTFRLQGSDKALRALYYTWLVAKVHAMQGEFRGTDLKELQELVELDIANSELEDDRDGLLLTVESIAVIDKIRKTAEFKRNLGDIADDIVVIRSL